MSFQENMFVTRPQLQGMKSTHPKTFQSIRAGIAALTLAATSVANTPPPLVDFPSSIPAALDRATAKPVDDLMMGTMSVKLEATSLATIRDAIGVGRIQIRETPARVHIGFATRPGKVDGALEFGLNRVVRWEGQTTL
jgi:hypothetical protein